MPLPLPGTTWPAETERWWRVISRMPHCILWDEAMWQFAIDTLASHARHVQGDPASASAELRNREKVLGTTMDFRRDLRIRYVELGAKEAQSAGVTSIEDFRKQAGLA